MTDEEPTTAARSRQREIYLAGIAGGRPQIPLDPQTLEQRVRRRLPREVFAFLSSGAGLDRTLHANRAALDRWFIVPRVLRDVTRRDLGVELFGRRLPTPFLLAPIGILDLAHRDAELGTGRAAAAEGVPMIVCAGSSKPLEECAAAIGDAPWWFQLYWNHPQQVESFVRRAEAAGCSAIVATVDMPVYPWRTRDLALGYSPYLRGKGMGHYTSDPFFLGALQEAPPDGDSPRQRVNAASVRTLVDLARTYPGSFWKNLRSPEPRAAVRRIGEVYSQLYLRWEDVPALRKLTKLPIVLKGILHPDDARWAIDEGMDGIVVSNHGGRSLDGAPPSIDMLPGVVEAANGRVPVLFDSGIRSGVDAFRALALGASSVLIGRTYVYALALGGEAGVRELIRNYAAELDVTMALAGCTSIPEIAAATVRHESELPPTAQLDSDRAGPVVEGV
jgi:lactate 2-monooxygenase